MFNEVLHILNYFKNNPVEVIVAGVIMVSAIIVLLGALKPILFDKIPNKNLRKTALALASVALAFPTTAICLWINGTSFVHYWAVALVVAVGTVITYWFYEIAWIRDLVNKIGTLAWGKLGQIALKVFSDKEETVEVKSEVDAVIKELNATTKNELVSTIKDRSDKELKNL